MIRKSAYVLTVAAMVVLSACSSSKTEVLPPTVNVSIGQQLIDLKKAKDAGVITESVYQAQVRRVVDSVK
jgi:predicted component of type VI protein secretion system